MAKVSFSLSFTVNIPLTLVKTINTAYIKNTFDACGIIELPEQYFLSKNQQSFAVWIIKEETFQQRS